MKKAKLPTPSEHNEQGLVRQWRDLMARSQPGMRWLFAVPNGGDRHPIVAAKLKAEGVVSGVADMLWIHRSRGYSGIAIEMKKFDGRLTPEQKEFLAYVASQGFFAVAAYGGDIAIELIRWYCQMRPDMPEGKYSVFMDGSTLCPNTETSNDGEAEAGEPATETAA